MTRRLAVVAFALLCAFATPAFARSHHGSHHHHRHSMQHHHAKTAHNHNRHHRYHAAHRRHDRRQAAAPSAGSWVGGLVAAARASVGETASQLGVRRTLWCMAAVNKWLAETGHRPSGSDLAKSALALGEHVQEPRVGALAVLTRRGGGHVGVVSGVDEDGNPIVISGNHRNRVAESVYPRSRVIAYVIPN